MGRCLASTILGYCRYSVQYVMTLYLNIGTYTEFEYPRLLMCWTATAHACGE